jgi:hypothetical protein
MLDNNWKYELNYKPCEHPGCLNHIFHPCEGCGRIGGMAVHRFDILKNNPELHIGDIIQEWIFGVLWECKIVDIHEDYHMIDVLPIKTIENKFT